MIPTWLRTVIAAFFVAALTGAASARLTIEERLVRLETQMTQVVSLLEEVRADIKNLSQKE